MAQREYRGCFLLLLILISSLSSVFSIGQKESAEELTEPFLEETIPESSFLTFAITNRFEEAQKLYISQQLEEEEVKIYEAWAIEKEQPQAALDHYLKVFHFSSNPLVRSVAALRSGHLYFNLKQYDLAVLQYSQVAESHQNSLYALRKSMIFALYQNKDEQGLFWLRKVEKETLDQKDLKQYELVLKRLRFKSLSFEKMGIEDPNISTLAWDYDDLWIGTWNGGILRHSLHSGESFVINPAEKSLESKAVRRILPTKEKIWIAQYSGLSFFDKRKSLWLPGPEILDSLDKIQDILIFNNELIIATLEKGVWAWDGKSGRMLADKGFLYTRLFTQDGHLFVGTVNNGLRLIEPLATTTTPVLGWDGELSNTNISSFSYQKPYLWVGTYGQGLVRFNLQNREKRIFTKLNSSLGDDWILSLVVEDNKLFIGTFGGGLCILDTDQLLFSQYSIEEGLPSGDIAALVFFQENILIGTLGFGIFLMNGGI